jgi:hypothetical protein
MEKADMAPFFLGERGVVAGRPYTWKGRCYVAVPCHVQGSASTSEKEFCFVTIVGQCSSLGTGCNSAGQRIIMGTLLLCLERC